MTTLLVRGIGALCTCDPDRGEPPGVISDAALVARDGILAYVGSERALPRELWSEIDSELDAGGAAVVPGLVDSHTHIIWAGERSEEYARRAAGDSYEAIAASGGGIRATVRATTAASTDALVTAAAARARRMRALGTTTVEVKTGYGIDVDAELRLLGAAERLRADPALPDVRTTYLALHAVPDGERRAYVEHVRSEGLDAAAGRARFVDAFCEVGAFTVEECESVLRAASVRGFGVKVHAEQRTHSGGAQLAARLRAVSADHLEHADDSDLRALAAASVTAVLLPGASLVLGGPPPPGRAALEAGVTVAIATDCNPGSCYSESMPLMLSLAVATAQLTPAQALVAATAGGARALLLSDRGLLRAGKRCDIAVLASRAWLDLAYHLGGDVVRSTLVAGRGTLA